MLFCIQICKIWIYVFAFIVMFSHYLTFYMFLAFFILPIKLTKQINYVRALFESISANLAFCSWTSLYKMTNVFWYNMVDVWGILERLIVSTTAGSTERISDCFC